MCGIVYVLPSKPAFLMLLPLHRLRFALLSPSPWYLFDSIHINVDSKILTAPEKN